MFGMVSEDFYYLLTSLDAHTVDLHSFKYGGTNFTAFRMIDTNKHEVKSVIHDIVNKEINQGRQLDIKVSCLLLLLPFGMNAFLH